MTDLNSGDLATRRVEGVFGVSKEGCEASCGIVGKTSSAGKTASVAIGTTLVLCDLPESHFTHPLRIECLLEQH